MNKKTILAAILAALFSMGCIASAVGTSLTPSAMPPESKKSTPTAISTANPSCVMVIALESLNLRSSPSEQSTADPQGLRHGDRLKVVDQTFAGWLLVQVADGRRGYVKADYVVRCE